MQSCTVFHHHCIPFHLHSCSIKGDLPNDVQLKHTDSYKYLYIWCVKRLLVLWLSIFSDLSSPVWEIIDTMLLKHGFILYAIWKRFASWCVANTNLEFCVSVQYVWWSQMPCLVWRLGLIRQTWRVGCLCSALSSSMPCVFLCLARSGVQTDRHRAQPAGPAVHSSQSGRQAAGGELVLQHTHRPLLCGQHPGCPTRTDPGPHQR